MSPVAPTVDAYLAPLPAEQRAALEKLRRQIRAAAPRATECISYGVPAFRLDGRYLVAFGAAKQHCSFFPGARPIEEHAAELVGWSLSKGTVRFTPDRPLPAGLVRKLVRTRLSEHTGGPAPRTRRARRPERAHADEDREPRPQRRRGGA